MIESYGFLALALTYEDPACDQLSGLNNVDWKKLSSQTYRYFLALAVAVSVLTVAQTAQALVMSGDSGNQVRQVQVRLQELGYFTANATGNFGSLTQSAVIRFQRDAGLTPDGIVGPKTLAALRLGVIVSPPLDTGNTGNTGYNRDLIGLGRGDSGPGVSDLQRRLQTLGYFNQQPTGNFGSVTENAVIRLQQDYNIAATGLVTEATLALLNNGINSGRDAVFTGTTLQQGDRGPEVTALQQRLQTLGFYDGLPTGYFGPETEAAVRRFQQSRGISANGVVSSSTLFALNSNVPGIPYRIPIVQRPLPPISNSLSIISLGDTGSQVRKIQQRLRDLNYYNGPINGCFDTATQDALIWFQESRGVTVNGIAGPTTQNSLFNLQSVARPATQITAVVATTPPISGASNIQQLQQRLRIQGLYNGPINGVYDRLTQQAVRQARALYGANADTVLFGSL
jgi:peptidoglycan hydrolase-like protein with peptidoglycan-binding domain